MSNSDGNLDALNKQQAVWDSEAALQDWREFLHQQIVDALICGETVNLCGHLQLGHDHVMDTVDCNHPEYAEYLKNVMTSSSLEGRKFSLEQMRNIYQKAAEKVADEYLHFYEEKKREEANEDYRI